MPNSSSFYKSTHTHSVFISVFPRGQQRFKDWNSFSFRRQQLLFYRRNATRSWTTVSIPGDEHLATGCSTFWHSLCNKIWSFRKASTSGPQHGTSASQTSYGYNDTSERAEPSRRQHQQQDSTCQQRWTTGRRRRGSLCLSRGRSVSFSNSGSTSEDFDGRMRWQRERYAMIAEWFASRNIRRLRANVAANDVAISGPW